MIAVLLIIHLLVATALVAVILMQHSEGGALGMSGGPSGMMTGRSAANLLTRLTMILGAVFIGNSILLAVVSGVNAENRSVIDRVGETQDSQFPIQFDTPLGDDAPSVFEPAVEVPSREASAPETVEPTTGGEGEAEEDDAPQPPN
jgi:preprotein translocase subunit SecG